MRNLTMKTSAWSPLTIHLERNTGIWIDQRDGLSIRLETAEDGTLRVFNANGRRLDVAREGDSKVQLIDAAHKEGGSC